MLKVVKFPHKSQADADLKAIQAILAPLGNLGILKFEKKKIGKKKE